MFSVIIDAAVDRLRTTHLNRNAREKKLRPILRKLAKNAKVNTVHRPYKIKLKNEVY